MKSYHLKWSSHLPKMGEVFNMLYESDGMTDVTLCCEEGRVRAHKLILSTCSDYFLDLFLENVGKCTYVVLPEITLTELKSILSFIYTGQIDVTDETLPGLLAAAETLGVRGLQGHSQNVEESTDSDDIAANEEETEADAEEDNQEKEEEMNEGEEEQNPGEQLPAHLEDTQVKSEPIQIKSEPVSCSSEQLAAYPSAQPATCQQTGDQPSNPAVQVNSSSDQFVQDEDSNNGNLQMNIEQPVEYKQNNCSMPSSVTSTIQPIQESKFSASISPLKNQLYNLQHTFDSGLIPISLATQQSNQLVGNMTSPFPGNIATSMTSPFPGNIATSLASSFPGNIGTSFAGNSPVQMTPSVNLASSLANLGAIKNLEAMYHQVHSQQQQQHQNQHQPSPVKILPKISLSDEDSPLKQGDNGKIQLELDQEAIRKILECAVSPVCPMCNKDCGNMPNLRSHLQVHNNLKPFACKFCDAKFARVSHLNRHIRVHTGEKPFSCNLCNKSFARQDKLKVHLQRHTKDGNISMELNVGKKRKRAKTDSSSIDQQLANFPPNSSDNNSNDAASTLNPAAIANMSGIGGYNPNSLWNGFPPTITTVYDQYEPVYPGMMQQFAQGVNNTTGGSSPAVMRIGECSIKPIGQS